MNVVGTVLETGSGITAVKTNQVGSGNYPFNKMASAEPPMCRANKHDSSDPFGFGN